MRYNKLILQQWTYVLGARGQGLGGRKYLCLHTDMWNLDCRTQKKESPRATHVPLGKLLSTWTVITAGLTCLSLPPDACASQLSLSAAGPSVQGLCSKIVAGVLPFSDFSFVLRPLHSSNEAVLSFVWAVELNSKRVKRKPWKNPRGASSEK